MAFVYPGDPSSGSSQTQNNNFDNEHLDFMCRGNNFKLGSHDPAYQYQTQKIIQNTVRVPSSLYTMNLGAFNVYQKPSPLLGIGVNWNQMSDRALPHMQPNSGNSQGSFYHGSSTRHTQTGTQPGSCTPGGAGVDIKYNSYYRYLNRLKAKKDIRRGPIPPTFGLPIPFSPAMPVYGGKTVKTSLVAGCNCPDSEVRSLRDDALLYRAHFDPKMFDATIVYSIGQTVYARIDTSTPVLKAVILDIQHDIYTVQFQDETVANVSASQIMPYFPCSCQQNGMDENINAAVNEGKIIEFCNAFNALTGPNYLEVLRKLIQYAI